MIAFHKAQGATATIAVHRRQVKIDLGVVQLDKSCRINGYIEKPVYDYVVSMGIYVFEPRVLDFIPYSQYLDFPDLVLKLIAAGEKVLAFPFDGYWKDLGRPDDYEQAAEDFSHMQGLFLPEDIRIPEEIQNGMAYSFIRY